MHNLRMTLSRKALADNWRALDRLSGRATTGAAVKADGYGLGAVETVKTLRKAGCKEFFVAHWEEAEVVLPVLNGANLSVLHGISPADIPLAKTLHATPVLNSALQIRRWQEMGGGRCHVMIDTGMNRLGLSPHDVDAQLFEGLDIDLCLTHLACADEDSTHNNRQLALFNAVRGAVNARRFSMANSAGVMLGEDYHFDCTRPGLSLYGGIARLELAEHITNVLTIEARVLQTRKVGAGDHIGYGATFTAQQPMQTATIAVGYADGYHRAFAGIGSFTHEGRLLPLLGRVSMDLVCVDITNAPDLAEGDWVTCDYDLHRAEQLTGISQYEHLTQLGSRLERRWVD